MCFCCAMLSIFIVGLLLFWFGLLIGIFSKKELSKGQKYAIVGGLLVMMSALGVWLVSALCSYICECIAA